MRVFALFCFFYIAVMHGMSEELEIKKNSFYECVNTQQKVYGALNEAIRENDIKKIQELIIQCSDKNKSSIYTSECIRYSRAAGTGYFPFYPVVSAVMRNKFEALKALLDAGCSPHVVVTEVDHNNLFYFAVTPEMVKFLLEYGVSTKYLNAKNHFPFEAVLLGEELKKNKKTNEEIVQIVLPMVENIRLQAICRLKRLLDEYKKPISQKEKESFVSIIKMLMHLVDGQVIESLGSRMLKTNKFDIFFE